MDLVKRLMMGIIRVTLWNSMEYEGLLSLPDPPSRP